MGREDGGGDGEPQVRDSPHADLTTADATDVHDSDVAVTDDALLRRAFGPDAGELDPREAQVLADLVRQRAADASVRRVVAHSHPALPTALRGDLPSVSARAEIPAASGSGALRPLMRGNLRRRLRAAAVGAAVAAVMVGIAVSIWAAGQPRPAVVLHGQPLPAGEIERTLEAEPNFFRSYSVEEAVSFGEAYGVRVLGATLNSTSYEEKMECIWLLDPDDYTIPLCLSALERPEFPRLIDIWYDGEAFTWDPAPRADLLQIRISVQGNRLEMWEETIDRSS